MRKRIGVTMRLTNAQEYDEPRDTISHDWIRFMEEVGYTPILIPNRIEDPVGFFLEQRCEGLLLTNGENVLISRNISLDSHPGLRDRCEMKLLSNACDRKIGVIGVCRGLQLINIYFGGSVSSVSGHIGITHSVQISDCCMAAMLGTDSFLTNSFHSMGTFHEDLADELISWAVCEEIVEGLRHKEYPIYAVQWHPERIDSPKQYDLKLFHWAFDQKV